MLRCHPPSWSLHKDISYFAGSSHYSSLLEVGNHHLSLGGPGRLLTSCTHSCKIEVKCFEKLIPHHTEGGLPPSFDLHRFANGADRSTEDTIAVHTALNLSESPKSYVGILVGKLLDLGLSFSVCSRIKEFLTQRPQRGKPRLLLYCSQRRLPAGVPAEPSPVLSADPRLPTRPITL